MKGCDYSTARPAIAELKARGIGWVGRYLTGAGKALTTPEVQQLHAAGLGIALIFEAAANDALGGASRGQVDGAAAKAAASSLSAPGNVGIYFTVDVNTTDVPDIVAYARAFAAEISPHPVGVYGEGLVLSGLAANNLVTYTWQTAATAWAGGIYNRATITQGGSGLGGAIDFDEATDTSSLWMPASSPRPPIQEDPMAHVQTFATPVHVAQDVVSVVSGALWGGQTGTVLFGVDGSIDYWGVQDLGAPDRNQRGENWGPGRQGKELALLHDGAGNVIGIRAIDTAEESYRYFLPGTTPVD